MQDSTKEMAYHLSRRSEIVAPPKVELICRSELVLPCPVDKKTGIVLATRENTPAHLCDEEAARRLIEKMNAA